MSVKDNYPQIVPSLSLDFARTKVLDPRITFSRASTAVFYDDNTVAKAEENLLTYSEQFDNAAWTKGNVTITANTIVAPDGTATADSFVASNAVNGASGVYRTTPVATTQLISCFVKAGNKTQVVLITAGGTNNAWFNLSTGLVGSKHANITSTSISDAGNGWYRISLVRPWVTGVIGVYFSDADNSLVCTGDGATVSGYVWGIQFEDRSSLTAYTPTTTQPITNYIPVLQTAAANVARFDHNPVTRESLGLLVEEQRTNLYLYSEDFGNAAWSKGTAPNLSTVASNTNIAPDGTLTADTLIASSGASSFLSVFPAASIVVTSGVAYTISVYAKKGNSNFISLRFGGTGFSNYTGAMAPTFNLNTGTKVSGTGTGSITAIGNGWYRITATATANATAGATPAIDIADANGIAGTGSSYTGYESVFIWGAQLEAGSFPTSYIKTEASQVTRAADSASMTGTNFSSWFNQAEGTTYVESSCAGVNAVAYPGVLIFSSGSTSNRFGIYGTPNGAGYGAIMMVAGGIAASLEPISGSTATIINTFSKLAYAYKTNDFAATRNALSVTTDAVGAVAVVNSLYIGQYDNYLNGTIKKLAYYPVRLSNTNLVALTQG